jgi:hypothetical protein
LVKEGVVVKEQVVYLGGRNGFGPTGDEGVETVEGILALGRRKAAE